MNCDETRRFLEADADDELDLVRHLESEQHLRGCPGCAALAANVRARRAALRENLPRFAAPAGLAEKVRAAVAGDPGRKPAAPAAAKTLFPLWQVTGLAASIAVAALFGFAWGALRTRTSRLLDDAVADHVRSLQVHHLTDVASTDQHTVKPWFAGKLDFSPPVADLATEGFPLLGGRLDRLGGHAAAALVFRRRQHAINLFVWPAAGGAGPARDFSRAGFHGTAWTSGGLDFLAVSEIPAAELGQFAEAFRRATR